MKQKICTTAIIGLAATVLCSACAVAAPPPLKAFKPAKAGQTRWVIELPAQKDESLLKVELFAGKHMQVDCNQHALQGKITKHNLDGWGYTYYRLKTDGLTFATRMYCPDVKQQLFVHTQAYTVRYNSKLPLVVYTPKGYQVRYRIWKTTANMQPATRK